LAFGDVTDLEPAAGYATRRDLTAIARASFWAGERP
jgi:hypothetical protein